MTRPDDPIHPVDDRSSLNAGISIREYFAAKIMAGFAADSTITEAVSENQIPTLAIYAVKWADALIVALNKGE